MLKKKLKAVSMSGASTKIVAHIAHAQNLEDEGFKPDIFAGVSSGALTAVAWAFDKLKEAEEFSLNVNYSDIFGVVPVNKKGKVSIFGYIRGLFRGGFGTSAGLIRTLRGFISVDEWETFKSESNKRLYCGVFNITLNRFELIYLNDKTYAEFIKYIVASATIPIYCDPIMIGGNYYWDGGIYEHNPSEHIIGLYGRNIGELKSIYSRPPKSEIKEDLGFNGNSIGKNLSKLVSIMSKAISTSNEESEPLLCAKRGIKLTQLFTPEVMRGTYDIDKGRLYKLYKLVRKTK